MNANENNCEVKSLRKDIKLINVIILVFLVIFGFYAITNINRETTMTNKMIELSQKANIGIETKTNTLFGVWTKVRLVK